MEKEEEAEQCCEETGDDKKQTDGCSPPHSRLHISTLTLASHWSARSPRQGLLLSRLSRVPEPKGCVSSLLSRGRLNTTTAVGPTPVVGFWGGGSQLVWEGSPHPQLDPQLIWQVVASWTHRNTLCHQLSLSNFTGGGVTQSLSVNNQLETGDEW